MTTPNVFGYLLKREEAPPRTAADGEYAEALAKASARTAGSPRLALYAERANQITAISEAIARANKCAETLRWITGDNLPLYVNVSVNRDLGHRTIALDPYTGEHATHDAREQAEGDTDHMTTLEIRGDGTWAAIHLLRI